jgi:hypothetical protein
MGKHCVYLWTLPMFHCNGWCFPWTLAVQARRLSFYFNENFNSRILRMCANVDFR